MRILFATGNENKIVEAREVLEPLGHTVEGLVINGQNLISTSQRNLD